MKIRVLVILLLSGCSRKSEIIQPVIKPLMEAVYASGFVVSDQEYQLFSLADGTVKQILVKEGEPIKKGQPLLLIESVQQNARYVLAKETYDQAVANKGPALAELESLVQSAHNKMKFDSINLVRFENLLK